jgi:Tumour suppressing sub-chromosomal transferable candidate 4
MSKEFSLTGGDADFTNRQKSVFDQLGSISVPSSSTTSSVTIDDFKSRRESSSRRSSRERQDSPRKRSRETKQFRGQESLFKRPEPPPPWRRGGGRMPDHRRNPQGWTHYSLGDVSSDDMSDRTNTSTALSFLNELKKRKDNEDDMDVDGKRQTLQFKRPVRKRNEVEVFRPSAERIDPQEPQFRGSKRVMPEYVVGQKNGKGVKRPDAKVKNDAKITKEMKLSHLNLDCEEVDEDD